MIADWIKEIVEEDEEVIPEIGKIYRNKLTGDIIKIIDGQYWGDRGLSNFWSWKIVKDGVELDEVHKGYGGIFEPL